MAVTWDSQTVAWDSRFVNWAGGALPSSAPPAPPLRVGVWRKTGVGEWSLVAQLPSWVTVEVEPHFLRPGPWSLSVPWDGLSQRVLVTDMLTFDIPRATGIPHRLMTGLVTRYAPRADETGRPVLDISGLDALALLGDVLCWPVPGSFLSDQTSIYYTASGPAETVLRDLIVANAVTRLGEQWVLPASQGRGDSITLRERFSNLLARVSVKADNARLGVRAGLVATAPSTRAEFRVEFYEPTDQSDRVRLSHKVGSLKSWAQHAEAPTVTRPVVGGGGKGLNRVFRGAIDATVELEWGRRIEAFIDARDTTVLAELNGRLAEALKEGVDKSGFELDAGEAVGVEFGTHFNLGDDVLVEPVPGLSSVQRLGGVRFSGSDQGHSLQLLPGNPDSASPMFTQAAIIAALRQRVRDLETKEDS